MGDHSNQFTVIGPVEAESLFVSLGVADQPMGLFSRPAIIDTRPYTRATASQRNRTAFRRH
jgi:hypothetical protein